MGLDSQCAEPTVRRTNALAWLTAPWVWSSGIELFEGGFASHKAEESQLGRFAWAGYLGGVGARLAGVNGVKHLLNALHQRLGQGHVEQLFSDGAALGAEGPLEYVAHGVPLGFVFVAVIDHDPG